MRLAHTVVNRIQVVGCVLASRTSSVQAKPATREAYRLIRVF